MLRLHENGLSTMSGLNATTVVDLRMTVDVSDWEASAAITSSESVTFNFNSKTGPLLSTMGARREMTPERQLLRRFNLRTVQYLLRLMRLQRRD